MLAIHLSTRCSRSIRQVDFGRSRQRLLLVAPGDDGRRGGGGPTTTCSWSSSSCIVGSCWKARSACRIPAAPLPSSSTSIVGARRGLAIRSSKRTIAARRQQAAAARKQENKTQSNEQLVATIMAQQAGAASAAEVSVRVTPDPVELRGEQANGQEAAANEKPAEPVVMTLQEAIQQAVAHDKDLVAIALNQEVPVLTISRLESLKYRAEKINKERRNNTAASSILKEATFKVGIADHDLQRKVEDVCKFLQKGHNCRITVKAPRRYARRDPTATRTMLERIVALLEENGGEVVNEAILNAEETQARFTMRPKKL